jgi:hypothetical protein
MPPPIHHVVVEFTRRVFELHDLRQNRVFESTIPSRPCQDWLPPALGGFLTQAMSRDGGTPPEEPSKRSF